MANVHLLAIWGSLLRTARGERKQLEIARACGVSEATISRIESGLISPSDELRMKLAEVFGLRVEDLFPYPEGIAS